MTDFENNTILEEFNRTSFGLELETCVHVIGDPYFTDLPMKFKDPRWQETLDAHTKKAVKSFYICLSSKFPEIKWKLILDTNERTTRYDQWVIMPDSSLECDYRKGTDSDQLKQKYCVLKGKIVGREKCSNFVFYPVEIVSPKLTGKLGLRFLTLFWHGVLLADNTVYSVNQSQGLHTNISNPNMDANKFLKLWVYFEPIVLQIIGTERRLGSWSMASPLSGAMKTNFTLMELANGKFVSVSLKDGNSPRLEVRIRGGSMDYNEVVKWTTFCMLMLTFSVIIPEDKIPTPGAYPETFTIENKNDLLSEFFTLIGDTGLIRFLQHDYNQNREDNWPEYKYKGPSRVIFKEISPKHFSDDTITAILRSKTRGCKHLKLN